MEVKTLEKVDPAAPRREPLARIMSPKGELAVLCDGGLAVRYIACLELRQGVERGHHYHKARREYFYVIAGEATLRLEEVSGGEKATVLLRAGDLVFIGPGIAHVFAPLADGHAMEFAEERFDAADIHRWVVAAT